MYRCWDAELKYKVIKNTLLFAAKYTNYKLINYKSEILFILCMLVNNLHLIDIYPFQVLFEYATHWDDI